MSQETPKEKQNSVAEKQPDGKMVAVPTQKTFSFYTAFSGSKRIDHIINDWLKSQVLVGRQPMLVKLERGVGVFGPKLIFVYMYSVPMAIQKTEK